MVCLSPVKRLLCVGLVAAVLLTSVAFIFYSAAQASRDINVWKKYPIPNEGGWTLVNEITDVIAIAVAYDGTIYAAIRQADGSRLFKSTDGGYQWTPLWRVPSRDSPAGSSEIIALVLPDWRDSHTLYLATRHNIYRSADGGEHFGSLGGPPGSSGLILTNSAVITSFGVVDNGRTRIVVAGTRDADPGDYGGVYLLDSSRDVDWLDLRAGGAAAGTKYDALAVAFSPNYASDRQIVALVTDEFNTIVTAKFGGSKWGGTVGDAVLPGLAGTGGSLAFPVDYDSDTSQDKYTHYFGLDVGGVTGGVYMVLGGEAPVRSTALPLIPLVPVHSISVVGEISAPVMVVGLANGNVISPLAGIAYTPPSVPPARDACVAIGGLHGSGYFVYAGTSGAGGGFARSVDTGATFARIAFINDDLNSIIDLAVSPIYDKDSTVYMITEGRSGNRILWRTTNRGRNWDAVLTEGQDITNIDGAAETVGAFDQVALSPRFTADTAVYIRESATGRIWRSTDNGFRFWILPLRVPTGGMIDSWAIVDNQTVLVGDSLGSFYKTTDAGLIWSRPVDTGLSGFSSMALSPDYTRDRTILAADIRGNVYLSADDGKTWRRPVPSPIGLGAGTLVAFSPHYSEDRTIYAVDAGTDTGIQRLVIGEDTSWQRIDQVNPNRIEEVPTNITGLHVADDGKGLSVLYATDSDTVAARVVGRRAAKGGIARSLNPAGALSPKTEAPIFEVVNDGLPSGATLSGLWYGKGHTLWSIDTTASPMVLYTYQDALTTPLNLLSPASGASSDRQASAQLSWQSASGAAFYEVWYDIDPGFGQSPYQTYSSVAHAEVNGLESGIAYYWRVRVGRAADSLFTPDTRIAIGAPVLSRFSATWSFTAALGGDQWSPFSARRDVAPLPGATNVPIRPLFQWNPADQVTGYELIVARDSGFVAVVVARTGRESLPTAAWACDRDLEYGTTYYWKVRAVSPTSYSQWATGIFTTEPASPTPPPPSPPQAPSASGTPASIWVMLAVLVVLVLVLLRLIMTRR